MIKQLKNYFRSHLINILGWRTDRKIVVIESDDWGMVRMASKEAYNWFLKKGYKVNECPVNRNDALESNDDLELLFEVLNSVKDKHGKPAVLTANNIVANPDFEKIKKYNFNKYFYEPFTKTLERYQGRDRVNELYKEGIEKKLFYPQFHGREHLNVNKWMKKLNSGDQIAHNALKNNMFSVHKSGDISCRRGNLDAFGMGYGQEWVNTEETIRTGLDLFEKLWGYRSLSFIAPCYIWPTEIENILAKFGIKFLQGTHVQKIPSPEDSEFKRRYHYQGQSNSLGQKYLVRNVFFEPALNKSEDIISKVIKQIENAFKHKKPAIICSHRFNYTGTINSENRDRNLKLLKTLLNNIQSKWPEVEFMTTDELGNCIENDAK